MGTLLKIPTGCRCGMCAPSISIPWTLVKVLLAVAFAVLLALD